MVRKILGELGCLIVNFCLERKDVSINIRSQIGDDNGFEENDREECQEIFEEEHYGQ